MEDQISIEKNALPAGTIIDQRYQIISLLNHSSTYSIYSAKHLLLHCDIQLKFLNEPCKSDASYQRLEKEIQLFKSLSHPNIATIYSLGTFHQRPFLAIEKTGQQTLAETLSGNLAAFSEEKRRLCLVQICEGLSFLHQNGILHRDLRPELIQLNTGLELAKISDLGFARLLSVDKDTRLTRTGEIIGSMTYASPEQLAGKTIGTSSDLFSLGCLIFETMTGSAPLCDGLPFSVSAKLPDSAKSTISPELSNLISALIQRDPAARPANVEEVRTVLQSCSLKARPAQPPLFKVLAAALITLIIIAGITSLLMRKPERINPAGEISTSTKARDIDEKVVNAIQIASKQDLPKLDGMLKSISETLPNEHFSNDTSDRLESLHSKLVDKGMTSRVVSLADDIVAYQLRGRKGKQSEAWANALKKKGHVLLAAARYEECIRNADLILSSKWRSEHPYTDIVVFAKLQKAQSLARIQPRDPKKVAEAKSIFEEIIQQELSDQAINLAKRMSADDMKKLNENAPF